MTASEGGSESGVGDINILCGDDGVARVGKYPRQPNVPRIGQFLFFFGLGRLISQCWYPARW